MTEWRSIEGEEGRYAVSENGEVMAMNFAASGLPGILKPNMARGYQTVQLSNRKRYTIHRLVAAAFIGPRPNGMQINHINGVKTDNRVLNLEYCTPSENMKHCFAIGLQSNQGEKHSRSKLKEKDVRHIKHLLSLKMTQAEIANMYGVSKPLISRINRGKNWSHVNMAAAGESLSAEVL
jgi:hypothetical protein